MTLELGYMGSSLNKFSIKILCAFEASVFMM